MNRIDMTLLKTLLGFKKKPDYAIHCQTLSPETKARIKEALYIIESRIQFDTQVYEAAIQDSDSQLIDASLKLKEAHNLEPDNPLLHYAYASALHCAGQIENARKEMERCLFAYPDFKLPALALNGWDNWRPFFRLPPWNHNKGETPASIANILETSMLLPVRECIAPRAVLFIRDVKGEFQDMESIAPNRIRTMNMISPITDPQIFALFVSIDKKADQSFEIQEADCPIKPRGDWRRLRWELFCSQTAFDLVIVAQDNRVLWNATLPMPKKMIANNRKMLALIDDADGDETPTMALLDAIARHRSYVKVAKFRY